MALPLYKLIVYDPSTGLPKSEITDFLSLEYTQVVNNAGLARLGLDGDHGSLQHLVASAPVEIWRKPSGGNWALQFDTLLLDETWTWVETGPIVTFTMLGQLYRLATRIVNWASDTSNRSKFENVATETIMKTLVDYNAGPNATAVNGRKRDGTISTISIQADGANGKVTRHYCHGDNLLKTLQELALDGGGDFDLVKVGTNSWEFRWYTGQLGTDRTAEAGFSMGRGNMANPRYQIARSKQKTVAAVWGRGEDDNRDYVTVTGPDYSADVDIEVYVDARGVAAGDTAALTDKGEAAMEDKRAEERFTFDVLQIPSHKFGEHYFLGDLVETINPFNGDTANLQIAAAKITVSQEGDEQIELELEP